MSATKPVINVADVPLRENAHGEKFKAKVGSFGRCDRLDRPRLHAARGRAGQAGAFPYHNHHGIHELFVDPRRRGRVPLRQGDLSGARR